MFYTDRRSTWKARRMALIMTAMSAYFVISSICVVIALVAPPIFALLRPRGR